MRRFNYEVHIGHTTAAYGRLARALVETHGQLLDSYLFLEGTVILLVALPLLVAEDFAKIARPSYCKYSSPTYFSHGTIMSMYASPADELADKKTSACLAAMEHDREREERNR